MSLNLPPPNANGYVNGNGKGREHDGMDDEVGLAYSTSSPVGATSSNFNQQYLEQQRAYQQAMQEQQERHLSSQEQGNFSDAPEGSQASSSLALPSPYSNDVDPLTIPGSLIPAQNRVFGLTKDLAGPSTETAHLEVSERAKGKISQDTLESTADVGSSTLHYKPPSTPSLALNGSSSMPNQPAKGGEGPQFSVEVVAPAFDKRGYPVFSGRGARIRGYLRTRPLQGCEVVISLFAEVSQGSPAAVFGGVALMPPEQGEKRVFNVEDRIPLHDGMASLRPGADPASNNPDDYIYTVPFDMNLPLGVATRFVNGEQVTTAVALPPSYEMSSKHDGKERDSARATSLLRSSAASIKSKSSRMTNFSTSAAGIGSSMRDAVERGLGEVYRIGCFYKIGFKLQRLPSNDPPKRGRLGQKKKKSKEGPAVLDKITVPFIFTGEPSDLPPPPHSIPLSLVAPILVESDRDLGPQWECERNTAKWSGNFFRTAKRQVHLEMHMPRPAVLQAPCVFPFILIIRPADPSLLASIPSLAGMSADLLLDTDTIHQYPRTPHSKAAAIDKEVLSINDPAGDSSGLVQKLKNSMSLAQRSSQSNMTSSQSMTGLHSPPIESSSSSIRGSLASTFSRRRPDTAPSGASSSDRGSVISNVGPNGNYTGTLSGLVKVTLLRTTYCISNGPSETPKARRKLISEAEIEEVDVESILSEASKADMNGERGNVASMQADQALLQHIQCKGIRVLRGLIRVGSDATPTFRCQGIEVKYALKVDLVPFSKKETKRPQSGGGGTGTMTPSSRQSINLSEIPSSPPLPPFPAEHRRPMANSPSALTSPNLSSQPHYSPSVALGLGAGGTSTIGGGGTTVVSESAMVRTGVGKGVGALWADVRMVRSALAS